MLNASYVPIIYKHEKVTVVEIKCFSTINDESNFRV